jgi:hypothetical protein
MARNNLLRIQEFYSTNPDCYDKISLTFDDGSRARCHNLSASLICKLHDAVNSENKESRALKLNKSRARFAQLVDFALRHSTFKIS